MRRVEPYLPFLAGLLVLGGIALQFGPRMLSGPREVLIFRESADTPSLPAGQQEIVASLLIRDQLAARGHVLLGVFDPDDKPPAELADWWTAAGEAAPPLLLDRPAGGGPIRVAALPEDPAALFHHLER